MKERQRHRVEALGAASIRALSGIPDLQFRAHKLHRGRHVLPLFAPHLHASLESDDDASFRGIADGLALRLMHSNAELHARLKPAHPVERLVFEWLEQFRVEAHPPPGMPGVATNLSHRFRQWSNDFRGSRLPETLRGLMLYAVAQVARARAIGEAMPEETQDSIEGMRIRLAPLIGPDLAALRRTRHDQAAYAHHSLAISRAVARLDEQASEGFEQTQAAHVADDDDGDRAAFALMMPADTRSEGVATGAASGTRPIVQERMGGYRIFTAAYDRECAASSLLRAPVLKELRESLDRRMAAENINIARMARELKVLLSRPSDGGSIDGEEEGRVDGRRLTQLVTSPTNRGIFRADRVQPASDSAVTFLIDCSGSMKAHAETIAVVVDAFARALDLADVACEVLGFTTLAWNGGRARQDWQRAGKPLRPGRLNELCHIVFKGADTSWRRARSSIAALLHGEIFREGIDGEALAWAATRLLAREQDRRLLVVISDGGPMDAATGLANEAHYLDAHLAEVASQIEQAGRIELLGVGVGLDLSAYYGRTLSLNLDQTTPNDAIRRILAAACSR